MILVDSLRRDLRDAVRSLRRNPGYAAGAVAILSLGIGVSTPVFSLADTVLRRPLPVREQDRLVVLRGRGLGNLDHVPVSDARYVAIRDGELGIRLALGASPAELHGMVIRQSGRVVSIGVAVGLVGALAGSRLVRALVFEVSPTDPASLLAVLFILVAVAFVAALVPARRAARVDPVQALRSE